MERLWKWLMHLDARALFLGSVVLFLVVAGIVAWLRFGRSGVPDAPREPPARGAARAVAPVSPPHDLGVLAYVSNQLAAEALVVPVNPFRPGIENLLVRPGSNLPPSAATNLFRIRVRNPWAGVRSANPSKPVIPTLTFNGYFGRPDGTSAALFHDSVTDSNVFYNIGASFHGATLVSADMRTAKVLLPGGETRDLAIGGALTLPEAAP